MPKEDVDVYAKLEEAFKRIYALEDKIKNMDKHGAEHQIGGADEIIVTRGLKFIAGDPDDTKKSGAIFLRNATAPSLEAWIKMIQTGDVYLNIPSVNNEFVLRYNAANYKVRFGHDGLIFRLTADNITGAYILPGAASNCVVNIGTNTDTTHLEIPGAGGYRRKGRYLPSYWTAIFNTPATATSATQNTWTTVAGVSGSLTTFGRDLYIWFAGAIFRSTAAGAAYVRLKLDGTSDYYWPANTATPGPNNYGFVTNIATTTAGDHAYVMGYGKLTGVAAGTYTVTPEIHDNNVLTLQTNTATWYSCLIAEE